MAMKMTTEAEKKARNQKLVLVVLGVALLGVGALQVPKLMGGSDSSTETSTPTASTSATPVAGATPAPAAATTAVTIPSATPLAGASTKVPLASVGGVQIQSGLVVVPMTGQLSSLSLFKPKDPFTQQISPRTAGGASSASTSAQGATTSPVPTPTVAGQASGTSAAPVQTPAVASSALQAQPGIGAPLYATISVNGSPVQVKLGGAFPQATGPFVLTALTPTSATIRIKTGSFTKGKQVTMVFERGVLLTDTKSGDRIALKLLYTGSAPQQTASFKASAGKK